MRSGNRVSGADAAADEGGEGVAGGCLWSGGHRHVHSLGKYLSYIAYYPSFLVKSIIHMLLATSD